MGVKPTLLGLQAQLLIDILVCHLDDGCILGTSLSGIVGKDVLPLYPLKTSLKNRLPKIEGFGPI